jgi:hypothetical protein
VRESVSVRLTLVCENATANRSLMGRRAHRAKHTPSPCDLHEDRGHRAQTDCVSLGINPAMMSDYNTDDAQGTIIAWSVVPETSHSVEKLSLERFEQFGS